MDQPQREMQALRERYDRRKQTAVNKYPLFSPFQYFIRSEREFWYTAFLSRAFSDLPAVKVLEVGAGGGGNLGFFQRLGIPVGNIWANEFLPDRVEHLKTCWPADQILPGDASELDLTGRFDVVFQSTVFSSLLDLQFRRKLAERMWSWLKPGGVILWYDFTYNNPWNRDVRGVPLSEVKSYFPQASQTFVKRVTLAPPIGRRVGRLYNFLNFPFLRTHAVAVFKK